MSVCSPHELVLTSPTVLESCCYLSQEIWEPPSHVSGTGSTLGEETARSELS